MLNIKTVHNEADRKNAVKRAEYLLDKEEKHELSTEEKEELDILIILIDNYEDKHHAIGSPDPIEFLIYLMENKNMKQADFVQILGVSKGSFSKIIGKKSPLSLNMIKRLHKTFNIPYDILMADYELTA